MGKNRTYNRKKRKNIEVVSSLGRKTYTIEDERIMPQIKLLVKDRLICRHCSGGFKIFKGGKIDG
jgi:predicted transcriptional regulator